MSNSNQEDALYMSYAEIIAKSCGEEEEEGGDEEGGGEEGGESAPSIHVCITQSKYIDGNLLFLTRNFPWLRGNLLNIARYYFKHSNTYLTLTKTCIHLYLK